MYLKKVNSFGSLTLDERREELPSYADRGKVRLSS